MAAFATLHGLHDSLFRSKFLGQENHHHLTLKQPPCTIHHRKPTPQPRAKFNILEMMGGRGLCNGEKGIEQELKRQVFDDDKPPAVASSGTEQENLSGSDDDDGSAVAVVPENGFEKELMGLTGGFPGGEKGLKKFIEKNPPPKSQNVLTLPL